MSWTDCWIGLPYLELGRTISGVDCLGFFIMLQRARFDRDILDPQCSMHDAARRRVLQKYGHSWVKTESPAEGDALLFRARGAWHIGFHLEQQNMLHIEDSRGSLIEPWNSARWGDRLEGIYRFGS